MPDADAEIARASMLRLAPGGFEEIEGKGWIELVAYTDVAGEASLHETFGEVSSVPVESGWEDRWRKFHRPVYVGGVWIGPPWEQVPPGKAAVVVDPGRAFGTGAHPTTRACIELLSEIPRGSLLDAGCGSGVVAVAAARLGFDPVVAVDSDQVAVDVARDTVRRNGARVTVHLVDVLRGELPDADVIVANIELAVVDALLARKAARTLVTSGYLAGETPCGEGWEIVRDLEVDGWAAHVLVPTDRTDAL